MKKRIAALVTAGVLALSMLTGCGSKQESWKVTCPWAPSGVAAMVSQKAAAKSPIILIIKSHWLLKPSRAMLLLSTLGCPVLRQMIRNWSSPVRVCSPLRPDSGSGQAAVQLRRFRVRGELVLLRLRPVADSSLNLKNLDDLEAYVRQATRITVAVNGATGSEAFLAAALFGSMGAGDQLKLTPYQSAAEAAQAVAKGETNFAGLSPVPDS